MSGRRAALRLRGRKSHRTGQAGELLIETLISLFLITTLFVAIISLLFTTVVSTSTHRGIVASTNEATTVAEEIDRAAYQPCGNPSPVDYSASLGTVASGYTAQIDSIEYLQDSASGSSTFGGCPGGGDQGVQRITVTVVDDKAPNPEGTIQLIKRDRTCPGGLGSQVEAGQPC